LLAVKDLLGSLMSQRTTGPTIKTEDTKQKRLNQTNSERFSAWNTCLRNDESDLKDQFDFFTPMVSAKPPHKPSKEDQSTCRQK
jgi:hypothetical protein